MQIQTTELGAHSVSILTPDGGFDTIFYTVEGSPEPLEAVYSQFEHPRFALVGITGLDWFADLSPWPAPNVTPGQPDFAGGADGTLRYLTEQCIPFAEGRLGAPKTRGITGYSLAGLFAVYAFYKTDLFSQVGCVSGSMWYDRFCSWMQQRRPPRENGKIHFSVGELESRSAGRFGTVAACMEQSCRLLSSQGYDSVFCQNPGGHFDHVPQRSARAISWLLGERSEP